jgi:hypothetical protein
MVGIRHPEFLNELENTKYPFVPTAALSNGSDTFLEGTFLDAHLYTVTGTNRYYISNVNVASDRLTITIGDANESNRMTGEVAQPIIDGNVRLVDVYGRSGGILVSEPVRLSLLAAWGVGDHRFEQRQTEFCVTCQVPVPDPGLTAIRLETGEILSGKVWLVGEDGVVLRTELTTDKDGNTVEVLRVDVVGDPLYLQRLCTPEELFYPVNPIRTLRVKQGEYIYDCVPDEQGNFTIQMNDSQVADAALRIRTTPEGIVVTVEGSTNAGGT